MNATQQVEIVLQAHSQKLITKEEARNALRKAAPFLFSADQEKVDKKMASHHRPGGWKAICRINGQTGELMAKYPSHTIAALATGIPRSSITNAVSNGYKLRGDFWHEVLT